MGGTVWLLTYQVFLYADVRLGVGLSPRNAPGQLWLNGASGATFFACNLWYAAQPENDVALHRGLLCAYSVSQPDYLHLDSLYRPADTG